MLTQHAAFRERTDCKPDCDGSRCDDACPKVRAIDFALARLVHARSKIDLGESGASAVVEDAIDALCTAFGIEYFPNAVKA